MKSAYKHLKRYGDIESIRTGCFNCLLIQYKDAKDAAKLMKISRIEIDHTEFEIVSTNKFHDVANGVCAHQATEQTDSHLVHGAVEQSSNDILSTLNDDCLREIFRKLHRFADFSAVANVCKRFNKIALEIFPLKIKQKQFGFDELAVNGDVTLSRLESFLNTFSGFVYDAYLNLDGWNFQNVPNAPNIALKMINDHCKNLRSLEIRISKNENENKNQTNWMAIHAVLPKLNYLKMHFTPGSSIANDYFEFNDFLSACRQLETLIIKLHSVDFELTLPSITFPKLVKLKLENYSEIEEFLMHNTQLQKIMCLSLEHNSFIGRNMLNLQELTLHGVWEITDEDVLNAKNLSKNTKLKLKRLMTDGNNHPNIYKLKNITTFHAEIYDPFGANHLLSLAQQNKGLEKLVLKMMDQTLKFSDTLIHIQSMLYHANQLTQIKIDCSTELIRFDEKEYEKLLEVVESRRNRLKLTITIENHTFLFGKIAQSNYIRKEKLTIFGDKSDWLTVILYYTM